MKIHEYNEMMAYLLRPRQKFANGGNVLPKNIRLTPEGQFRFSTQVGPKPFSKVFPKGTKLEEVEKFRDQYLERFGIKKGQLRQVNPDRGKYVGVEGEKHIKFNGVTYQVAVQRMKDGKMVTEKPYYTTDLDDAIKVRDERVTKSPPKIEKGVFNPDREKQQKKVEKRRAQQKLQEGRLIKYKAPKGYQVHHIMPLAGYRDMTDKDIAVISAEMNQEIAQFDKPINKLVKEAENLNFDETKSLSRLQEINEELAEIVKKAEKKLGPKYKGLIGFNKLTPVLDTFDDKGRQVFSAEPVGIDYSKTVGGKSKKATKIKDISTKELQKLVAEAPTFGSNLAFGKALGSALKYVPTPAATVGLSAGFGIDPESSLDRTILGTELAAAPALVKQSSRITSNPLLRRVLNLGLSPQMAMRVARAASPIGILSLLGEAGYNLGKEAMKEQDRIDAMSPEEREEFLAEQEDLLGESA
jgi:hypothetical protein